MRQLFVAAILFVSIQTKARVLNCSVYQDTWYNKILEASLHIDAKPTGKETVKNRVIGEKLRMNINGDQGELRMWMSATWFKKHKSGSVTHNNMSDTFPLLDIGAFFYKDDQPGPYPGPDYIGMRTSNSPHLDYYRSSNKDPKYHLYLGNNFSSYIFMMKCVVLD